MRNNQVHPIIVGRHLPRHAAGIRLFTHSQLLWSVSGVQRIIHGRGRGNHGMHGVTFFSFEVEHDQYEGVGLTVTQGRTKRANAVTLTQVQQGGSGRRLSPSLPALKSCAPKRAFQPGHFTVQL